MDYFSFQDYLAGKEVSTTEEATLTEVVATVVVETTDGNPLLIIRKSKRSLHCSDLFVFLSKKEFPLVFSYQGSSCSMKFWRVLIFNKNVIQ